MFKQTRKDASSADQCDSNSLYKESRYGGGGGYCYSYLAIDAICVRIAFVKDSASYSWQFVDGCYDDGAIGHYKQVAPNTIVDFESLPIEVRQTNTMPSVVVSTVPTEDQVDAEDAQGLA